MTIYNLGNIKGEKGDKGDSITGPTGPVGVGIKSIEQITQMKFKFCLTDGSEYIINYGDEPTFDDISVSSSKDILSYADGDSAILSAQLTNSGSPVSVSGESVTFEVRKVSDDSLVETLTDTTDSNGEASVEYFGKGVGDLNIKVKCRSVIEIYGITDAYKYTSDGSGLDGNFTVTGGYITNCQSDTGISNFDLTGDFEFAYKYYNNNPTNNDYRYNSLWVFGLDNNNGVFLGCEDQDRKIRVYNRNNGSTTSIQQTTNVYNRNEWIDVSIKYVNGVWSITVGANTITYSKTFNPTFIHLFDNYTLTRIKEVMIKPL